MNAIHERELRELAELEFELQQRLAGWIRGVVARQAGAAFRGGHDEANFAALWGVYYRLTGDERVRRFLFDLREDYRGWLDEHAYHGFQGQPRDHNSHAFENAEDFLTELWRLEPEDDVTIAMLDDIAHHVGNWVPYVPDWYDWDRHMFQSYWLGTRGIRDHPPYNFEKASNARIGSLMINVYRATGRERYLDWCRDYATLWVQTIAEAEDRIPMYLYPGKLGPDEALERYTSDREDAGDPYHNNFWPEMVRHVAAFLLDLYGVTGEPRYLEAVQRAIHLFDGVLAPDRMVDLCLRYHQVTGDDDYRSILADWYAGHMTPALDGEHMEINTMILTRGEWRAFGHRDEGDRVRVYHGPRPSGYLRGYRVSGDAECLRRAMDHAAARLALVQKWVRDGREHGCATRIFAHGCGNDALEILGSAAGLEHFDYFTPEGIGPGERTAVLWERSAKPGRIHLFNGGEGVHTVGIRGRGTASGDETVELPPRAAVTVEAPAIGGGE